MFTNNNKQALKEKGLSLKKKKTIKIKNGR